MINQEFGSHNIQGCAKQRIMISGFQAYQPNVYLAMQNQIAAYLPSPSPVILIVYRKEPYQYFAVFVNQTRQQAEDTFKQKYNFQSGDTYEVKEYENVESYSVAEDGNLLINGTYK